MGERYNPTYALFVLDTQLIKAGATDADYVLFGSMALWFNGLRDDGVGDLDVFVRRDIYDTLLESGEWRELRPREDDPPFLEYDKVMPPIHVFYDWTERKPAMNVERCFQEAQLSEGGWRYAPLTQVVKWKEEAGREQDLEDIEAIHEYWENDERQ